MSGWKAFAAASLLVVMVAQANSDTRPMIKHNPDGTFTVQKGNASAKNAKGTKGLVIPPQVVAPMVPTGSNR